MKIQKILNEQHAELSSHWVDAVLAGYSEKTTALLRANTDPFTNPVGSMIREAAEILVTAISGNDIDADTVKNSLDRFIKIRAVQDFTPSQSIGVIALLKPILRKLILPQIKGSDFPDYLEIESRVDTLMLLAFDMYTKDREAVCTIRIKEIQNQYAQLKRWAQALNADAPMGTFAGCGHIK